MSPIAAFDSELAWAAGFFDGEGWIGSRYATCAKEKPKYRRIEIGITQVDPEVLNRFKNAVGVGAVKGPYYSDLKRGRSRRWYFSAAGAVTAWRVFWDLEPYLSPIKRAQFTEALDWYEESPVSLSEE